MPSEKRPPASDDPGRPTPRESVAKARAAAGPAAAKATAAAGPAVEKAAERAGKLLGTLRDRAKITAKEFTDAYGSDQTAPPRGAPTDNGAAENTPTSSSKRPRPGPR